MLQAALSALTKEADALKRANIWSLQLSYLSLISSDIGTFQSALAPLARTLRHLNLATATFSLRQEHAWCACGLKWMFFRAIGVLKRLQVRCTP